MEKFEILGERSAHRRAQGWEMGNRQNPEEVSCSAPNRAAYSMDLPCEIHAKGQRVALGMKVRESPL